MPWEGGGWSPQTASIASLFSGLCLGLKNRRQVQDLGGRKEVRSASYSALQVSLSWLLSSSKDHRFCQVSVLSTQPLLPFLTPLGVGLVMFPVLTTNSRVQCHPYWLPLLVSPAHPFAYNPFVELSSITYLECTIPFLLGLWFMHLQRIKWVHLSGLKSACNSPTITLHDFWLLSICKSLAGYRDRRHLVRARKRACCFLCQVYTRER